MFQFDNFLLLRFIFKGKRKKSNILNTPIYSLLSSEFKILII